MITLDARKNLLKKNCNYEINVCVSVENRQQISRINYDVFIDDFKLAFAPGVANKFVKTRSLPFFSQYSLLIPLGISENLWFYHIFRGIKSEHWEERV